MSALSHSTPRRNVGERVLRVEDPALLRGRAGFVDDVRLPGTLVAVFVRSPHAHAAIRRIDASAARAMAGVHAVYTLEDLRPHLTADRIPLPQSLAELQGLAKKGPRDHVTARDTVSVAAPSAPYSACSASSAASASLLALESTVRSRDNASSSPATRSVMWAIRSPS